MTTPILLEVDDLRKNFGIIVAVDGVSFKLEKKQTKGLIGPNGAGKTTLLNCLSGVFPPTEGEVVLNGNDVTGHPPHKMAHKGLSRSFQITNLFEDFTVFENIRLAAQVHESNNLNMWSHYSTLEEPRARAREVLDLVGLSEKDDRKVGSLSHGEKRLVEIGIAITPDPMLILLDEPTAGMASDDASRLKGVIQELKEEFAIILVEHNVDLIMDVSDEILVMHQGRLLAEGTPENIQTNEQVQEAYLGAEL